jgi:hypothetical protein
MDRTVAARQHLAIERAHGRDRNTAAVTGDGFVRLASNARRTQTPLERISTNSFHTCPSPTSAREHIV